MRPIIRKTIRSVCLAVGGLVLLLAAVWAVGALYFDLPIKSLRGPLAIIYGGAMLANAFWCDFVRVDVQ